MDDNTLNRIVLDKRYIKGDEALTAVEYVDLSAWVTSGAKCVIRVSCVPGGGDMVALLVESATPTVTPTATSVTASGTMWPIAAGSFQDFEMDSHDCFLAWGSISGTAKGRVARMSP